MKTLLLWLLLSAAAVAGEINHDQAAFAHAQAEANTQAARERVGHFLGIAPGCRFAGVGQSMSTRDPRHCHSNRHRLVARAFAISRSGKVYWSAQYK